jgi:hypothetical protein
LLTREIVGRLHPVAHGQCGVPVKIRGLLHHFDEVAAGNLAEHIAGALRLANVFGEQAGIGLAHFGEGFARRKVNDVIDLEARVRPAPAQHRNIYHNHKSG